MFRLALLVLCVLNCSLELLANSTGKFCPLLWWQYFHHFFPLFLFFAQDLKSSQPLSIFNWYTKRYRVYTDFHISSERLKTDSKIQMHCIFALLFVSFPQFLLFRCPRANRDSTWWNDNSEARSTNYHPQTCDDCHPSQYYHNYDYNQYYDCIYYYHYRWAEITFENNKQLKVEHEQNSLNIQRYSHVSYVRIIYLRKQSRNSRELPLNG